MPTGSGASRFAGISLGYRKERWAHDCQAFLNWPATSVQQRSTGRHTPLAQQTRCCQHRRRKKARLRAGHDNRLRRNCRDYRAGKAVASFSSTVAAHSSTDRSAEVRRPKPQCLADHQPSPAWGGDGWSQCPGSPSAHQAAPFWAARQWRSSQVETARTGPLTSTSSRWICSSLT